MASRGIGASLPSPAPADEGARFAHSLIIDSGHHDTAVVHLMKQVTIAITLALVLTLGAVMTTAIAEPYEDTPDASARDPDYAAGKMAMEKKNWSEAVKRFQQAALRHPDSADLHNYLGFSYRNLKQMDLAFKSYKRSIELNPRHRGAHEYIGEAYLMMNDLPGAERHLAALRRICLLPCEELADLEKVATAYRARPKRAAKP